MRIIDKYKYKDKNKTIISNESIFDTIISLFKKNPKIQKEVSKKQEFNPSKVKESLSEQLNELKNLVKPDTIKQHKLKANRYDTLFIGKGNNNEEVVYKLLDKTIKDIPKFLTYAKFVDQLYITTTKRLNELKESIDNGKDINNLNLDFPSENDIKLLRNYFINQPYITVGDRKTLSSDIYIGFNRGVILLGKSDKSWRWGNHAEVDNNLKEKEIVSAKNVERFISLIETFINQIIELKSVSLLGYKFEFLVNSKLQEELKEKTKSADVEIFCNNIYGFGQDLMGLGDFFSSLARSVYQLMEYLIDSYKEGKEDINVSNESFIDSIKSLFGAKSNTYGNLRTLDELLNKLQERYKEVSSKMTPYSKSEVDYTDSYRKYFYTNKPLSKYNDILNLVTTASSFPTLIQQYDNSVVKDIIDRSKKITNDPNKLPEDEYPEFPLTIKYDKLLWSKGSLFKHCEKNLSLSDDYHFDNDGYRTEFYFDGNYLFVVNDLGNLIIESCTLSNDLRLKQSKIDGCKDPKKILSLINNFIKASQYFKSKNNFYKLIEWVNEVRYEDRLYLFDSYFSNLFYFGNDGYNEIVEIEKILIRGMLITLDWVESSFSKEKTSIESYPSLGIPL